MLAFARETRLSETTFVQRPSETGADYRNRIFTVAGELPFAGHPSLGTAVAVARRRGLDRARLTQETGVGHQAIEVELDGHHPARASMLQEPASFGSRGRTRTGPRAGGPERGGRRPGAAPSGRLDRDSRT